VVLSVLVLAVLLAPAQLDHSLDAEGDEHGGEGRKVGENEASEHKLLHRLREVVEICPYLDPDEGEQDRPGKLDDDDEDNCDDE
jgi:hypothetical protein